MSQSSCSFHPSGIVAIVKAVAYVLLLSGIAFLIRSLLKDLLWTVLVVVWALGVVYVLISFIRSRLRTITLGESTLTYQTGILSVKSIVLPYSKITEASYSQGIVGRLLGVGSLSVDTPGGSDVAIHMNNVSYDDLRKILDEINSKSGRGGQ